MKSLLKNLGLILILIGAVVLAVCFFTGYTNDNTVLGASMVTIIVGLLAYIILNKRITD